MNANETQIEAVRGLEREMVLLARHITLVNKAHAAEQELDRSAYLLLSRLEISEPMTLGELAASFGLDVSTVNRQTAALLRDGFAERIADPDGGTARRLRPTEAGLAALRRDRSSKIDGLNDLLADWDEADRRSLVVVLRRLNEEIERRQGLSWPRD
ncbi:MarR family winged helix-turn-helix transcriptional regulator [Rhodococcus sp. NPDC003318]|uniref:MarR family winged helix-turn-helix transcriptional regulator n=1 Tax=Rhodococcus sp. NPDC003318 TaxID=3364503 RepID=UPI0036921956